MPVGFDDLIRNLGQDLRPVRRLASPAVRATGWLALLAAAGAALAAFADLGAIAHRLGAAPDMWLAVLGSALTAALAALAAFQLSLPDRSPAWALLPLPGVALWIAASGAGCMRGWAIAGAAPASMREMGDCFGFIVILSLPLSAVMILMIRRACPLRPELAAAIGGLAVAAGAATLLNFVHPYDAGAMDLAVHLVAVALVIGLNRMFGGRLLAPNSRPAG